MKLQYVETGHAPSPRITEEMYIFPFKKKQDGFNRQKTWQISMA